MLKIQFKRVSEKIKKLFTMAKTNNNEGGLNTENVSIDAKAIHGGQQKPAKDIFCEGWPTAKIVLESIKAMVKNPIVKGIIGIVIATGDGLQNQFCN